MARDQDPRRTPSWKKLSDTRQGSKAGFVSGDTSRARSADFVQPFQGSQAQGKTLRATSNSHKPSDRAVLSLLLDTQICESVLACNYVSLERRVVDVEYSPKTLLA